MLTDDGVIGILIAHLRALGSGGLKVNKKCLLEMPPHRKGQRSDGSTTRLADQGSQVWYWVIQVFCWDS